MDYPSVYREKQIFNIYEIIKKNKGIMKNYTTWIILVLWILTPHPESYVLGAEKPQEIFWNTLRGLNYKTGKMTKELTHLNGKLIRIPGFMVPLEEDQGKVYEFLFVPTLGACIHVPPPPPNLTIYVKMPKNSPAKVDWEPVWVEGVLKISKHVAEMSFGVSSSVEAAYELAGRSIVPYTE